MDGEDVIKRADDSALLCFPVKLKLELTNLKSTKALFYLVLQSIYCITL